MKPIKMIAKDLVQKNKKNNYSIMLSIFIAVLILSVVVIEMTSINKNNLDYVKEHFGDYCASIYGVNIEELQHIKDNPKVEKIAVSTEEMYLNQQYKRPQINLVKYDDTISKIKSLKLISGNYPIKSNEVIVPNQFLIENENFKIGDKVVIGKESFIITGVFSSNLKSFEKNYSMYGYLGKTKFKKSDKLKGYIWFKNERQTYKLIPEIVSSIKKDPKVLENQGYLSYNITYLYMKDISESGGISHDRLISIIQEGVILILLIILFVMIISNAYIVWNTRDLREIGIFKSIGMTKKQIGKLLKYKILYISTLPIIAGVIGGYFLSCFLVFIIDKVQLSYGAQSTALFYRPRFQPIVIIFLVAVSYLIVTISATKPAKKSNRISIVQAVNNNVSTKDMKLRNIKYGKNILKSMARENYLTYKKNYTGMTISLVIVCVIFSAFLISKSYSDLVNKYDTFENEYDIKVGISTELGVENEMIDKIQKLNGVNKAILYCSTPLCTEKKEMNNIISKEYKNEVLKNGNSNSYNTGIHLYGILDKDFNNFLREKEMNYEKYYNNKNPMAMIVDNAPINFSKPYKRWKYMPFVNKNIDKIYVKEHLDNFNKSYDVDFIIGNRINEVPYNIVNIYKEHILLFMPLSEYNKYFQNLYYYRGGNISKVYRIQIEANEGNIKNIKNDINEIVSSYIPKSDFSINTREDDLTQYKLGHLNVEVLIISFMIFLLAIGFVNAFSSVNLTIKSRKKDLRILKSIGLDQKGIIKMMKYESGYMFRKFIVGTLILIVLFCIGCSILLNQMFSPIEILLNLNVVSVIVYFVVIILGIHLSYMSSLKIKQ